MERQEMRAFGSIEQGLEEAKEFSKGQGAHAIVHEISPPAINVAEVRARTGLSQSDFAKSIGVAKGTLLNWEQGRQTPQGQARVLLALIERNPSVVRDMPG